ncbi:MAG TPA: hypothetical protein VFU46_07500 [Gemmatimonadales bacterium]|nr:hypothetical protein [Gemmatimonadales bacterium]
MRHVPELGPALGRLTLPADPGGTGWVPLDDIRLELVTAVFELAAAARAFDTDDAAAAVSALNRAAWLGAWEHAVATAAARIGELVTARLLAAAVESRLPRRRRDGLPLTAEDRRAIAARLGHGSLPFLRSLDALERLVPAASASGRRGEEALAEWPEALLSVARRLESAWLALEHAAAGELEIWTPAIEQVRSWRRPAWPLWTITAAALLLATYVGLVLGGYLPAVGPLEPLARALWQRS